MKKTLLILFFVACNFLLNAQNPVSRNLTNQNGLPSNTVYNILQDSKGFIWLGHDKGLSRYDGNTFVHFTAPAQQGKSISNLIENNGVVWCQDFSGNFYYTNNNALQLEKALKTTGGYSPAGFLKSNRIAVINYDSLRSFDLNEKKSHTFPAPKLTKQAVYHGKYFTYFFSGNTLKRFNGLLVETLQIFNNATPDFNFLIKADNDFIAFNRNSFPFAFKVHHNYIEPLNVLKNGLQIQDVAIIENEVWISTTSGAYCFDKKLQPLYNGQCFFANQSITKIIKDREGNYWFGTLNNGVLIAPDLNVKLFKYSGESITALSTFNNNDEILAGTSSNLIFSFNSTTNQFYTIASNDTKGEVYSMYYDKPLKQIVACGSSVAFYKNGAKYHDEALAGKAITLLNNSTYAAAFSGGIALIARNGTQQILPDWIKQFTSIADGRTFLTQGIRGRAILFDSTTQTLYSATAEGIKFYNKIASGKILLHQKPIYASSLCMVNNILYAGTFSDGLIKINNFKAEELANKNISTSIYKLYTTENYLWIVGDDKIQRYNISNNTIDNYSYSDGLPKAEIKDILVQNNIVYLATTEGLVLFNSNKESTNKIQPLLQLNKFLVNDKEKLLDSSFALNPEENNIELLFSILSFKDNAASSISYKINNEEWKALPTGLRNLQLASMAAGKYTVQIKAINEDGIAAEKIITVKFSIAAPFYKKGWFYAILASLFFAAMYIYFKQRLKSEKKNNELLAQKIQLEQELHQSMLSSIKSQMNPHFLFNALNTIQSYIYTNEKENASLYLGKFSELTRTILEMSNKEKVTLAEEIKALQLYVELEQLRFEDKLKYTFEVDKTISTETTYIPSMLIQPYVENAIKHGLMHQKNTWQLHISFKQNSNSIEVKIDDNGIGRKASEAINQQKNKRHQSFASDANEKRLNILNKGFGKSISLSIIDKIDEHGYAIGTTVVLNIPLN